MSATIFPPFCHSTVSCCNDRAAELGIVQACNSSDDGCPPRLAALPPGYPPAWGPPVLFGRSLLGRDSAAVVGAGAVGFGCLAAGALQGRPSMDLGQQL